MNTQFILPAVTAMAFHAILFFGLNGRPPVVITPGERTTIADLPPMPVSLEDPVPPDDLPNAEPEPKMKKGADVSPPVGDEPPLKPDEARIAIDVPPVSPHVRIDSNVIPHGVVGDPKGDDDGIALNPGRPFNPSELDAVPRARVQIGPVYPPEARVRGMDGEVLVAFTVDEEGRVLNPRVMRSTDAVFDEAACRAVAKWRFEPGRRHGRVVRFNMAVPMRFRVNE